MPTPTQTPSGPRVPPPRYKMALLTWPGAWGLITLILWLIGPAMATWPLPLRTLVISALMVLGLSWVVIPYLTRVFAGWLAAPPRGVRLRSGGYNRARAVGGRGGRAGRPASA
jgi:antibiotic biosynthesis monooxygenase (ABM) superfamily enzyme